MMLFIKHQYARSRRELAVANDLIVRAPHREERVVVPIPGLNRAVVQAINVGRSVSDDVRAVYITDDADAALALRVEFERQIPGVPLVVVESPYRTLVGPLLAYLDVLDSAWPPDKDAPITFVVMPEYVARQLVGADPLQPVVQATADRPARTAAHGRGRRPVPEGGSGHVRAGTRRRSEPRRRRRTERTPAL